MFCSVSVEQTIEDVGKEEVFKVFFKVMVGVYSASWSRTTKSPASEV